jgi:hypothetical protein
MRDPAFTDPRPDLAEDSAAWGRLLRITHEQEGIWVAAMLAYFRAARTRLRGCDGQIRIAGEVDGGTDRLQGCWWWRLSPAWGRKMAEHCKGKRFIGWESIEQYRRERDELLKPRVKALRRLLDLLAATPEGQELLR